MKKHWIWAILTLTLGTAWALSWTGLYGTGTAVGYINMVLVFGMAFCAMMMKRAAVKETRRP